MDIGTLCKRSVVTVEQSASLQDAARLMRQHHVGALVVTAAPGPGARVLGVITDRDLVVEAMAQGADAARTPVEKLLGGQPVAVPDTTGISEAIAAMRRAGVRRLLVITPKRQLAGIVSIDDLLAACAVELQALADAVRQGLAHEADVRRPLDIPTAMPPDLCIADPAYADA